MSPWSPAHRALTPTLIHQVWKCFQKILIAMWCCVRHPSGRWKEEIGKFYSRKRALVGSLLHHFAWTDGETQEKLNQKKRINIKLAENFRKVPLNVMDESMEPSTSRSDPNIDLPAIL
ncbi:unnamed protein product [Bursaphelenchus xylophilus]|uniref:(pine wood nematode) hypothetical protein n=1 Tax=Bursaphelenchus xylophilus TaxID=6326 RepID=A0A811LSI5_BURXY|nr:unnamed protein product [Bursaphelenchus xylophilus]CAG9122100.1 unnamed protein product [Bursaphelenchus xylophilus]